MQTPMTWIERFILEDRKKIFLLDGIGALMTALIVGFVVGLNPELFGVPSSICKLLSLIAFVFAAYSCGCFFLLPQFSIWFLFVICAANSLYILYTLALVVRYFETIKVLGIVYFILEAIIVGVLISFEVRMILRNQK